MRKRDGRGMPNRGSIDPARLEIPDDADRPRAREKKINLDGGEVVGVGGVVPVAPVAVASFRSSVCRQTIFVS